MKCGHNELCLYLNLAEEDSVETLKIVKDLLCCSASNKPVSAASRLQASHPDLFNASSSNYTHAGEKCFMRLHM